MVPLATILDLVSVFFTGMLAGIEFVLHYGVRAPAETLDDHARLQLRQALVRNLRVMVPAFFAPAAALGLALTLLNAGAPGLVFRCVEVAALVTWTATRVVGTVRVNSDTLTWQLSAPPADWKAQITHAERFHQVGVGAAVVAFVCALIAVALKLAAH